MTLLAGLRRQFRAGRLWLAEREVLRFEGQVLAVLAARPGAAGRPLGELPEASTLAEADEARLRQLEAAGPPWLGRAHDAWVRMPRGLRRSLKRAAGGAWRLLRGLPAQDAAPSPSLEPVAVPFGPGFPPALSTAPVAAIVHLFHPDLASEIRRYLEAMPVRTDVFVSTDTEDKRQAVAQAFSGWAGGAVEIRLAPNRGRDIAPKLIAFRDVYDRYDLVLHLHGKVSSHDSYLRLWRYFIFETLLGSPQIVSSILAAFEAEPRLGMVAAAHFYPVQGSISWGGNLTLAQALAQRMAVPLDVRAPLDFPSGSMFWARSAALRPLLDLNLQPADFPEEAGQKDGTLAHAIERLYFLACAKSGHSWLTIARPELMRSTEPPMRRLDDPGDLSRVLMSKS